MKAKKLERTLTTAMLPPYKAKGTCGTGRGWYYVSHDHIEVFGASENQATQSVKLTRVQLERALKIMRAEDKARESR